MDSDPIRGADAETVYICCALPNLHNKAKSAVGYMYGLAFNTNKLLHLKARISQRVISTSSHIQLRFKALTSEGFKSVSVSHLGLI